MSSFINCHEVLTVFNVIDVYNWMLMSFKKLTTYLFLTLNWIKNSVLVLGYWLGIGLSIEGISQFQSKAWLFFNNYFTIKCSIDLFFVLMQACQHWNIWIPFENHSTLWTYCYRILKSNDRDTWMESCRWYLVLLAS